MSYYLKITTLFAILLPMSACISSGGQLLCDNGLCSTNDSVWIDKFAPTKVSQGRNAWVALYGGKSNCTVIALSETQFDYILNRTDTDGYSNISVSGVLLNIHTAQDVDDLPLGRTYTAVKDRWVDTSLCPNNQSTLYATDVTG